MRNVWQCETCSDVYWDASDAQRCESGHPPATSGQRGSQRSATEAVVTAVRGHVDAILGLVTRSSNEQRERIAVEIAKLDGGGVRHVLADMAKQALKGAT